MYKYIFFLAGYTEIRDTFMTEELWKNMYWKVFFSAKFTMQHIMLEYNLVQFILALLLYQNWDLKSSHIFFFLEC